MLGVIAAAISEVVTGQTVWSQIAGKYVEQRPFFRRFVAMLKLAVS